MSQQPTISLLSIVIPLYNEAATVDRLVARVSSAVATTAEDFEIIFVDDGSRDATIAAVARIAATDRRVKLVALSRNYGKEIALTAGLDHAQGDVVVFMDGDLQHPPEYIPQFADQWRQGYQMVYGIRSSRETEARVVRRLKSWFYLCFNKLTQTPLPVGAGDFRLFDRKVADAMRQYREAVRFMKGIYASVGFRSIAVPYDVADRAAGRSSWNLWKLWNFALTGLTSHTTLALRIWGYLGFAVAIGALLYAAVIVVDALVSGIDVPGYASTVVLILFFGSLQMISMGVLGEYVARLHEEVKRRPIYVVEHLLNLPAPTATWIAGSAALAQPEQQIPGCGQGREDGHATGGRGHSDNAVRH